MSIVKTLAQKPLALFVTTTCPFCINARRLASHNGLQPDVVELDRKANGDEIRSELAKLTNQRTVPYVFSKGEFIGGYSDLAEKPPSFWENIK